MSAIGLVAARDLAIAAPGAAAILASELRGAVTGAMLAADQVEDQLGDDIADSVRVVLLLAEALGGG
jgi:hypothetical protein